jgi:hypothetical protein
MAYAISLSGIGMSLCILPLVAILTGKYKLILNFIKLL